MWKFLVALSTFDPFLVSFHQGEEGIAWRSFSPVLYVWNWSLSHNQLWLLSATVEENNNRIVILLGEKCMFHVCIKCVNQIWRQHTPTSITLANNATAPFHFQHYIFNSQYILNDSRKHSSSYELKRDKQCSCVWVSCDVLKELCCHHKAAEENYCRQLLLLQSRNSVSV